MFGIYTKHVLTIFEHCSNNVGSYNQQEIFFRGYFCLGTMVRCSLSIRLCGTMHIIPFLCTANGSQKAGGARETGRGLALHWDEPPPERTSTFPRRQWTGGTDQHQPQGGERGSKEEEVDSPRTHLGKCNCMHVYVVFWVKFCFSPPIKPATLLNF